MLEFMRRVENGEEDVEVLIASRIPSRKWENCTVDCFSGVFIEARHTTTGTDVFIAKIQGDAQASVTTEISGQLSDYAAAHAKQLYVGAGNMELVFPQTQQRIVHRPDTAFRPIVSAGGEHPPRPRLVVEVEILNKSLRECDRYCREFFSMIPQLRAAFLIKVFRRTGTDRHFACLAVLYRLNEQREVFIADMVSFGSAAADPAKIASVSQGTLQVLPLAPVQTQVVRALQCPWDGDDCAAVQIPAEDILSDAINRNTGELVNPEAFDDLQQCSDTYRASLTH